MSQSRKLHIVLSTPYRAKQASCGWSSVTIGKLSVGGFRSWALMLVKGVDSSQVSPAHNSP
jgi:hypothetical protein